MPDVVLQTVIEHLELEARIGGYEAAAREDDRVEATYDSVARLLGCSRDEVAIVENATRAWDMAFYSFDFQPGDRILTCGAEYASNYIALLQVAQRTGAEVVVVGDDESGQVSLSALEQELERGARLVSLVHVPSQGGLIQPAAEVGRLCRAAGVPLLLDACQSVGQLPDGRARARLRHPLGHGPQVPARPAGNGVPLRAAGADRGARAAVPRPARGRVGRPGYLLDPRRCAPVRELGDELRDEARARRRRSTMRSGGGWRRSPRVFRGLRRRCGSSCRRCPGVEVHDRGEEKCAIVTFTVAGESAYEVAKRLERRRRQRLGHADTYSRLDLGARGLDAVVRASVHYYNTEAELERLVGVVASG